MVCVSQGGVNYTKVKKKFSELDGFMRSGVFGLRRIKTACLGLVQNRAANIVQRA